MALSIKARLATVGAAFVLAAGCSEKDSVLSSGSTPVSEELTATVALATSVPGPASTSVPAPASTRGSAEPTIPPEDPWVEALMAAENPLMVAYGLPDDAEESSILLADAAERLVPSCMSPLGFEYWPEVDEDARQQNATYQNALPIDERQRYNDALFGEASGRGGCKEAVLDDIYIAHADPEGFVEFSRQISSDPRVVEAEARYAACAGQSTPSVPAGEIPDAECAASAGLDAAIEAARRAAEVDYALSHRELIETLAERVAQ